MNGLILTRHHPFLSRSTMAEIAPAEADAAVEHFICESLPDHTRRRLPFRPMRQWGDLALCG